MTIRTIKKETSDSSSCPPISISQSHPQPLEQTTWRDLSSLSDPAPWVLCQTLRHIQLFFIPWTLLALPFLPIPNSSPFPFFFLCVSACNSRNIFYLEPPGTSLAGIQIHSVLANQKVTETKEQKTYPPKIRPDVST